MNTCDTFSELDAIFIKAAFNVDLSSTILFRRSGPIETTDPANLALLG
jgi:hypothetical protein